ncbi:AAA family ATPase [Streptomyces sp. NPDC048142]|uniref:AAA family ATPase n=1 Tax=Streptomyces sp. NPDC048142 TaxID=3365501 RepID=UPI003712E953
MIVWVNGAFGSGKSTLVDELRPRWPEALVYDPEMVGYVLREIVEVPTGDFQDLPLWRRQVANLAVGLIEEYRRPVLVPMTLVDPGHVGEIFGALKGAGIDIHHFFLKVSREVLEKRIDGRNHAPDDPEREQRIRRWCKDRIGPCVAAADTLPSDTVFLDGELSPQELAGLVLTRIDPGSDR